MESLNRENLTKQGKIDTIKITENQGYVFVYTPSTQIPYQGEDAETY
jgi:hypothetical protein